MYGFITLSDVKSNESAHVIFELIRYASSDGSEAGAFTARTDVVWYKTKV